MSEHQDLLFRCKVGRCRTSHKREFNRSCFLYANQLNDHHKDFHSIKKSNPLDTSKSMTGLSASKVNISCSKCSHFVLFPDTRPMVKHLWSVHRKEDVSLLRYHCRVCSAPFSSVEKVVEHSRDHLADRSQAWTDSELDQGFTGKINWNRSRAVRSRSPVSKFSQYSECFHEKYLDILSSPSRRSRVPRAKSKRSLSRERMRYPSRKRMRYPSRKRMRSSSRKSRSSGRNIVRSPSRMSMRSNNRNGRFPSRMSRRCSGRDTFRSPSRERTRSTYRNSRSSSRTSRRSHTRTGRRSPSGKIRRSPSYQSRRSPSRIRRSASRKSRRSPRKC